MPAILADNCQAIKALNPDFDYRFYEDHDREALIKEHFGQEILARYLLIDPAFGAARADFFRYLCLYHFGGVYLDIKVRLRQPLSSVLYDDDAYLLSQWDHSPGSQHADWGTHWRLNGIPGGEYQQWYIITSPRHPFLAAVIANLIKNIDAFNPFSFGNPWEAVICTTGPVVYTTSIHQILDSHPHRLLSSSEDIGISYSIFAETTDPDGHRRLYRDYRKAETPLIRQPFPLSLLWILLTWGRKLMGRIRRRLSR
jgi:inositol phosphorylceramide mannosyltransferase catalytic subunit